ncbi:MAG: RnfABCDGE type electron transport complex subunit D [Lachnospiraceae bacterium]|jgi:electron transport complex protein RnfD|nr:RnfABCDGE type electron transport complex subunit D [Lachnospiraceae bacterium]
MENQMNVSASPHIRGTMSTSGIMRLVILALLPAAGFGIYNFGIRALYHMLVCVVTCVLTEFTYEAFADRPVAVGDFSSMVTGLLLALSLPVNAPLWMGFAGSIFAILIVKMFFGGIGQNIVNPALAGRCFLLISFAGHMTNFVCDAYTGPTPLEALKQGEAVDPLYLILGNTGGCIGETSALAILAGGILLLAFGIINLRIPASCFAVFTGMLIFLGGKGFDEIYLVQELCSGGLMLAFWFMATDYTTSPITKQGQILYGMLIGALAGMFRLYGSASEGVSYAILLANLLTPMIEKVTVPRAFGRRH